MRLEFDFSVYFRLFKFFNTLPYLTLPAGRVFTSRTEATVLGPMRNAEVRVGQHDILEVGELQERRQLGYLGISICLDNYGMNLEL